MDPPIKKGTGRPAPRKEGDFMRKRKKPGKRQRRDNLPKIGHLAAALYWFLRLVLMLWDRFAG